MNYSKSDGGKSRNDSGIFSKFFLKLFGVVLLGCGNFIKLWIFIFSQVVLVARLTIRLVETLGFHASWMVMAVRLLLFVYLLLPALLECLFKYLTLQRLWKNIAYGKNSRNSLDIYKPDQRFFKPPHEKRPVVVLLSGGAWIIGYKAWNMFLGLVLRQYGIVVVSPDYRNYPQGNIDDMLLDVNTALEWTFKNVLNYGGDPEKIYLVGQSAGGQLGITTIIQHAINEAKGEKVDWSCSKLRAFIGVSSPYSMPELVTHVEERGLSKGILETVFKNEMEKYSPYHLLETKDFTPQAGFLLPPITLIHGSNDRTCPVNASKDMHERLQSCGLQSFYVEYPNKSHTEPILEDPLSGNNPLVFDILSVINGDDASKRTNAAIRRLSQDIANHHLPTSFRLPKFILKWARWVNPF